MRLQREIATYLQESESGNWNEFTTEREGVTVYAEVLGWLWGNQPLSIYVSLEPGALNIRKEVVKLPYGSKGMSKEEVLAAGRAAVEKWLDVHGVAAIVETDRVGQGRMKELMAEYEAAAADESESDAKEDRRQKSRGFTHRVDAFVHPHSGDDYKISYYSTGAPSPSAVARVLASNGSVVLTDYRVTAI